MCVWRLNGGIHSEVSGRTLGMEMVPNETGDKTSPSDVVCQGSSAEIEIAKASPKFVIDLLRQEDEFGMTGVGRYGRVSDRQKGKRAGGERLG